MRQAPKSFLMIAIGLCCFGSASAEMYKCVENGKTTYQGTPCLGTGATATVKPAIGSSTSSPPPVTSGKAEPAPQSSLAKIKENVRSMEVERKLRDLDYEIENLESKIRGYQSSMERDLAALRTKKDRAMNNLAGATYEQSISTEMQAVSDRYKVNIQIAQEQMSQLRNQAAELRKSR